MKKTNVIIYVDNLFRLRFFKKICLYDPRINYYVICTQFSIYVRIKKYFKNVFLLKPVFSHTCESNIDGAIDVINGTVDMDYAILKYNSFSLFLYSFTNDIKINSIWMWNGLSSEGKAITDFSLDKKINILYFELSNIPGTFFVDSKGVNALSVLYKTPELLDSLDDVNIDYDLWLDSYEKLKAKPLPQLVESRFTNAYWPIDVLSELFNYGFVNKRAFKNKIKNKLIRKKNKIIIDFQISAKLEREYVFLALQVKNDTQLKINSNVNNLDAFRYALNLSENEKCLLYVKIHPAETCFDYINEMIKLAKGKNVLFVSNNTIDLIKNSKKVIVINSTVGLEALIYKKEVEFLGRSFFSGFDFLRLKKYLFKYLIACDPYDSSQISLTEFNKIIDKLS